MFPHLWTEIRNDFPLNFLAFIASFFWLENGCQHWGNCKEKPENISILFSARGDNFACHAKTPSFCLSPFLQCGEREAKEEGEVWHGGSPEGNMKPFSNILCTAPALGCCIRTIYCSATQGNSATRGCLSRHEASCPGCSSPSFLLLLFPLPVVIHTV